MRTYSGRPISSLRFSALTAMATSVFRRSSVRERSAPPTARLKRDICLDQSTPVVTCRLLPAQTAALSNQLQMAVSPCRCGLDCIAQHGARSWRDDDFRVGMPRGDLAVDTVLIIRTVSGERGDRTTDLIEQRAGLGGVIDVVGGQRRRRELPGVGVHTDVQITPGTARPCAVLLDQPLARAAQF
jgi:hypothetical protein